MSIRSVAALLLMNLFVAVAFRQKTTIAVQVDGEGKTISPLFLGVFRIYYYKSPKCFWENLQRYDSYDRAKSEVYVAEYAAHDDKRRSTQSSTIAIGSSFDYDAPANSLTVVRIKRL